MTTAFAIGVLALAAACGLSFVWWMFSGAAAWLEPDEATQRSAERSTHPAHPSHPDDDGESDHD